MPKLYIKSNQSNRQEMTQIFFVEELTNRIPTLPCPQELCSSVVNLKINI